MDGDAVRAALAWWVAAGVDTPVGDAPTPWLRAREVVRSGEPGQTEPREGQPPSAASDRAETSPGDRGGITARAPVLRAAPGGGADPARAVAARRVAEAAADVASLADAARAFAGPGALLLDGDPASGLLFVTHAPMPGDVAAGRLLADAPGLLFDRMLAAIGRDRTRAGVAAAAMTPDDDPADIAFLERLIALHPPRAIVALGGAATARLTDETRGLNRLRGRWTQTSFSGRMFPVLPTFHPAHLLAHPAHKALAWADLLTLSARLDA